MAESNATQVILTDDGLKIIKAQNTADNAAGGVANLNDPNLMSVIEKQNNIGQFAGLTSQYNVLVQNAKDDGIDTTAVTTAYNDLNKFMADILEDPSHASDIDRVTYKKYQDAYNQELANIQNALQNNANNKFASAANATSQAATTANAAKSAADSTYAYANSEISVQSTATAKAQKAADDAFSQAVTAIDTGQAASQAVTALKDGSTLTIAELGNGLAEKVSNSEYASYKEQTASQIGQLVTDGAFSAYQQTTKDLISSKVATSDFSSYKDETARAINSKVESRDFNTYKTQTDSAIESKVSNGDFSTYKTQTANDIDLRVTKKGLLDQINLQAGNTLISSSGQLTLSGKNIYFDSSNPVIIPSANIDTLLVDKKLEAADISANTFSTNNETFTVDKYGAVVASNLTIRGVTNLVYNAALLGGNWNTIPGWTISNNGCYWPGNTHDGVPSIGWNNTTVGWTIFAQTKLYPLNGATGQPFSASVWFKDFGSDTSLQYSFGLVFFDSNQNRIESNLYGYAISGMKTAQPWKYMTVDNAVAPSNAVYVGLQYWSYNGHGNACFSSPMLTQTAHSTGYQPDVGNVVSAGIINGSVINGSTMNGTTFHGGDIINDANNMSKFYPTTISSDGHIYTTRFNPVDAMQTDLSTGALTTKYRAINTTNPNNHYEAYDTTLQADQIALFAGYTNGKDMSFTQSVTGSNQEGYVLISPLDGLTLHGDNQQITFNGTSDDVTPKGIFITPYGNINPNGTQNIWYVGNNMNMKTASFGIDGSGTYGIQFNRSLDIGNFNINTYHTITSSDNGPIHFNRADGKSVDIFAATVNYTSLVKSSLLSVKRDVRKADTAYWAQLVNSIDLATYQYKTDDNTSHIRLSSIVDDVNVTKQWQLPDVFISRDEDGKLCGVDDSVLLNATLATVQEQQKEIDQLNGHLLELEAKLNG
ncbi:phage tail protein [Lactiplantibacillus plantarum]|uniref:phage tail protein n=1 Tax=Lactiplantibacillus plantarum TaxID=1590 RepID=UPI002ED97CF4|nr:phage tail protein [Lactiplantibacillus plantarum]MCG0814807.1 phage tail protein [Lactiplantibacillus plantarum]MCG0817873.1 phage tail protein [Lactiplantibacillus plantarum]MCG0822748.1 phage tail protein [Lactiplantibacillus plantarum]MCG0839947.1 phage tail protein [Lactiplantibacillus plantarum]